eukprot:CCRYP_009859-RA/>CCRYP_009859-RA protein AED:0.46 eAED:0.46 QI:0/-1/0/1/-1/1/1/0/111
MKKTVSWSSETLQRDRELAKALTQANNNHAGASTNDVAKKMTKSQSASISEKEKPTSPAVQSRIQQMIAMQKAQNATMRQLMSTGCGGWAAPVPAGCATWSRSLLGRCRSR